MIYIINDKKKAERTEASRPVDFPEYKQALDRGKPIDILRLNTDTCPEDTREIYVMLQNESKQRRR